MVQTQIGCLLTDILPALKTEGMSIAQWADLTPQEQDVLEGRVPQIPGAPPDASGSRPGPPLPLHEQHDPRCWLVRAQPPRRPIPWYTPCARPGYQSFG